MPHQPCVTDLESVILACITGRCLQAQWGNDAKRTNHSKASSALNLDTSHFPCLPLRVVAVFFLAMRIDRLVMKACLSSLGVSYVIFCLVVALSPEALICVFFYNEWDYVGLSDLDRTLEYKVVRLPGRQVETHYVTSGYI